MTTSGAASITALRSACLSRASMTTAFAPSSESVSAFSAERVVPTTSWPAWRSCSTSGRPITPLAPARKTFIGRLEVDVDGVAEVDPVVDVEREELGVAHAAVAGRLVHRYRGIAVRRVTADEVDGHVHAVRVRPRLLAVEVEGAAHGRGRGLPGRDVEGGDHVVAVDQGHHLPGDVHLDVVPRVGARLERAAAHQEFAEDHRLVLHVPRHAVHLAKGDGGQTRPEGEAVAQ